MKKIVTVLGARPQFIKASAISKEIAKVSGLTELLVHTGQHFDPNMSDVFFTELGIESPAYSLDVSGGPHGEMTGRMLIKVEEVLLKERPDAVLVYGDTNSTLAGALAAVKLHIPVAHVEAGLRSFNMAMPEEVNRTLTDRISQWLFTPTVVATENLLHEGVDAQRIIPAGDVMYDVALHYGSRVVADTGLLQRLGICAKSYILVTVHRAENTDYPERLVAIVDALEMISRSVKIVWPMHPRTRAVLHNIGRLDRLSDNIILVEPVGYLEMVQLEKYATLIATDSGGVQKEAFFYRVPCVTLRDETEWIELVQAGWNRLAPPIDSQRLVSAIHEALGSKGQSVAPYGQGDASNKIVERLLEDLN